MIENWETAFYTLAFLCPGFVIASVIGLFVPPKADLQATSLVRFLTLTFVNYAIWSWLVYLLLASEPQPDNLLWSLLGWTWVILLGPLILGVIAGRLSQTNAVGRLLGRFGFDTIHPIPSAWDYVFSEQRESAFVIVTLKDDSTVAGSYGEQSFSSSDENERDLFLEEIYRIDEYGEWKEIPGKPGILITKDEVRTIEFFMNLGDYSG